jgi:hypothetical protein
MRATPTCTFVRTGGDLVNSPMVNTSYTNQFSLNVQYSGTGAAGNSIEFNGTADAEL